LLCTALKRRFGLLPIVPQYYLDEPKVGDRLLEMAEYFLAYFNYIVVVFGS